MRSSTIRSLAVAAVGASVFLAASLTAAASAQPSSRASAKPAPAKTSAKDQAKGVGNDVKDVVIFRNGKQVEGFILEETDTTIKMKVLVGTLTAETVYNKADILTIERDVGGEEPKKEEPAAPAKTEAKPAATPSAADATRVYLLEITGEFGRDISATPLRAIMADVKSLQPDVLVIRMDTDFKFMGEERPEFLPDDANAAFNQLETARQLGTMLTDDIANDPEWKTKPRLVCWVRRALGGAAFVPFIAPEIYYTPDGRHGGIGYLELIFEGIGDKVVQEKQYSLRLARAEGLAIKGGHEPKILRAMSRADYVLSVRFEGGQPVFLEREPRSADEILLTDDGSKEHERRDTIQDVVRFRGNDVLTLDAELAYRLGLSRGTARTFEDLAFLLGIERNYTLLENRSKRIIEEWGKGVTDAERNFMRLWRDFYSVQVQPPGGYQERTAARGAQIRILQEIKQLLDRYGEAINPRAIRGAPQNWETEINLMIEQLKQQQRLDRR